MGFMQETVFKEVTFTRRFHRVETEDLGDSSRGSLALV